ncbi:hypothetical protein F4777DRAFT_573024 [Nemania sp. FL0916]|nr:hypothetical protein F4777DRAFT_573024 [Nemania sp. FL0916]
MDFLEKARHMTPTQAMSQGKPSYLLQLPLELIQLVARFLEPQHFGLLAQTCRPLRFIFRKYTNDIRDHIPDSHWDTYEYLMFYAKDRFPDKFACPECLKLHPFDAAPPDIDDFCFLLMTTAVSENEETGVLPSRCADGMLRLLASFCGPKARNEGLGIKSEDGNIIISSSIPRRRPIAILSVFGSKIVRSH